MADGPPPQFLGLKQVKPHRPGRAQDSAEGLDTGNFRQLAQLAPHTSLTLFDDMHQLAACPHSLRILVQGIDVTLYALVPVLLFRVSFDHLRQARTAAKYVSRTPMRGSRSKVTNPTHVGLYGYPRKIPSAPYPMVVIPVIFPFPLAHIHTFESFFLSMVWYHETGQRKTIEVGQEVTMTDNETTPEYRAWVDANRAAVEAQRADLEAAIRRCEQSLESVRQELADFDGENFMGENICSL